MTQRYRATVCVIRFSGGEQWITTYVGATAKSNSPASLQQVRRKPLTENPDQQTLIFQ
jgi:hypothetical protein